MGAGEIMTLTPPERAKKAWEQCSHSGDCCRACIKRAITEAVEEAEKRLAAMVEHCNARHNCGFSVEIDPD